MGSMMNEFPESQPTQSVESFNAIIKKVLNSASSLCDIEKVIDKRHEAEFQYCKLANLKAYQTTVGLPHLSSQFFFNIDAILNQFLMPLVLSWQKFQISQSFTYEGHLVSSLNEVSNVLLRLNIIDEPQITLASLLNVILLDDGTHLCTCLEIIMKAIETSTNITSFQITCTFQSLHHIQGSDLKTAINVALKTNSNHELITLLKDFIESKREKI
ncbi:hypothetical protein C1646_775189 [Rhizophagus diaphanus]|nr:hypothetical protein C1646_775189 [Rhizophagus diaphanus] [Rhizophagus sp. MUCL 43196]